MPNVGPASVPAIDGGHGGPPYFCSLSSVSWTLTTDSGTIQKLIEVLL